MPMLPALVPVTPSKRVWEQIARRIRSQASVPSRRAAAWRWAVVGVLSLSLVVGLSIRLLNPPLLSVAAIGQDAIHPLWRISRTGNSSELKIVALHDVRTNLEKAYELWALPRGGRPPVSLGLLPRDGTVKRALTAAQRAGLIGSDRVAVSLEPKGGSPTGQPTGPVLFVVDVHQSS